MTSSNGDEECHIPGVDKRAARSQRIADWVREEPLEGNLGVADESDRIGLGGGDRAEARRHAESGG